MPFGKKSSIIIINKKGSAAMVVPDKVPFEGGAGETIRRKLLHECDVHTMKMHTIDSWSTILPAFNYDDFDKGEIYNMPISIFI